MLTLPYSHDARLEVADAMIAPLVGTSSAIDQSKGKPSGSEPVILKSIEPNGRTALEKMQEVFLAEYKKLAAHAHIKSYLPMLACNSVRGDSGVNKFG